jgi:hypothetical protein
MGFAPGSSKILSELFGDLSYHQDILQPPIQELKSSYVEIGLNKYFESLAWKSISLGPMVLSKELSKDLKCDLPDDILRGIGCLCLLISTHDDIVDETPEDQLEIANLIYSGNIAANKGVSLLKDYPEVLIKVLEVININHLNQVKIVEKLWRNIPETFEDYLDGINHIQSFAMVGFIATLTYAKEEKLLDQVWKLALYYGRALQLVDDLREVDEDKESGYNSFPVKEGLPYTKTWSCFYDSLDQAENLLLPGWENMKTLINRLRLVGKKMQTLDNENR